MWAKLWQVALLRLGTYGLSEGFRQQESHVRTYVCILAVAPREMSAEL